MAESDVNPVAQVPSIWSRTALAVLPCLVATFIIAPRTGPALLLLLFICLATLAGPQWQRFGNWRPGFATIWLTAFGAYLIINASWALDLERAYGKVLFFFVVVVVTFLLGVVLVQVKVGDPKRLMLGLAVAFVVAAVYLVVELVTVNALKRGLYNALPFLRPSPKHAKLVDGQVVSIGTYVLNRSLAALCLTVWPALMLAWNLGGKRPAYGLALGIYALTALAVFWSQHETSKVALALATITFLLAYLSPRLTSGLVAAAWLGACLLVVPLALQAYKAGWQNDARLPVSARARVILWGHTSELVMQRSWLGMGVGSTKYYDKQRVTTAPRAKGQVYAERTGKHAHNIYLQTWFELGVVGAVFLAGLGLAVLRAIRALPSAAQPFALAAFASAAATAGFSWGMWQTWYMAFFAFGFAVVALCAWLSVSLPAQSSGCLREKAP